MKPKKKTAPTNHKITKKIIPSKPITLIDKTNVTTKQKTHTTIEEAFQNNQHTTTLRSARNHHNKQTCLEKMEQCNLSPFSSPGGSSISPRYKRISSPRIGEEAEKKKNKLKNQFLLDKQSDKKKIETLKKDVKLKNKLSKEQSNQVAYQKLLIRKMNEKKITQMSEQCSTSITKLKKLNLNIIVPKQINNNKESRSVKQHFLIKDLKDKIKQRYQKQLPSLIPSQLKFLCSIVLIQRLWRQHKIKNIINEFISPRQTSQNNVTSECTKDLFNKFQLTATTQEHTSELIRKYHLTSNQKKDTYFKDVHSTEINSSEKKINLKDLEISQELTPEKQRKMVKFVECLRDISFSRKKKSEEKGKTNVFSLRQSLSEKCLIQTFYQKLFKNSPTKRNNFQFFSQKKDQKSLERSIELINTMKKPQKLQIIQIQQRFQTQLNSDQQKVTSVKEIVNTSDKEVSTDPIDFAAQNSSLQINSLKSLNLTTENIMFILLQQFSEQFFAFTRRSVLKKKKKSRLPGLTVTTTSIRQYLLGLTDFMMKKYDTEVIRRFRLINPLSFLKIHHEYDEDQEYEDEDQDQINMPIVPNTLFYEYQLIYEETKFIVTEQNKKYSNFLQGLIKIHNLLLANCLSQILQKNRIDRIVLPWDRKFNPNNQSTPIIGRKHLQRELSFIIDKITESAFQCVGQFHKCLDDPQQQKKILKSINQQYKSQGNDWNPLYEYLQVRMEITKSIEQTLFEQLLNEIVIFL